MAKAQQPEHIFNRLKNQTRNFLKISIRLFHKKMNRVIKLQLSALFLIKFQLN